MNKNSGSQRLIGRPLRRVEDPRVLLGKTRYVDDIQLPGMVFVGFYRSRMAHAKITGVDTSDLASLRGVLSTVRGRELAGTVRPLPFLASPAGCRTAPIHALAVDRVRFVGEPITAVVAESRYLVEDSLDLITVDYEPLPVVTNPEESLKGGTILYDEWNDNVAYSARIIHGDVDSGFASASSVIDETFRIQRQQGVPLETRGAVAHYDEATDHLTVWASTQHPHFYRTLLAETLSHPEHRIRVIAPDVGGGFGNRQDFYREDVVVACLAKKLGRPVKWINTRSEDISSTVHSREQVHFASVAFDREGRILGLRDRIVADLGALHVFSLGPPSITLLSMTGPYMIENVDLELKCVVTNKVPLGAYRGFGQPQSAFVLERLMDMVAYELGKDPAEVRRINLVKDFPYRSATGRLLDSGNYVEMLDRGLQKLGYQQLAQSDPGGSTLRGVGMAFGLEGSGVGPTRLQDAIGSRYKGFDSITLRIEPDSRVVVMTGLSPHGQGLDTALSQVCAEMLGVSMDDILVVHGDSSATPYGYGTWGSRSAVVGANALVRSIEKVKEKIIRIASNHLGISQTELEYRDGKVYALASRKSVLSLRDVARLAWEAHKLPAGEEAGLEATVYYEPEELTISGAFHIVEVEVDVDTGRLEIKWYLVVHDCGHIINPMIVEGQIHGAVAQGIGGAVFEEIVYDENGQLLTTNLMDYLTPGPAEIPEMWLEHVVSPSPFNPLGIKGMGESAIVGSPVAVANAVANALRHFRIKITETPIKQERLWRLAKQSLTSSQ